MTMPRPDDITELSADRRIRRAEPEARPSAEAPRPDIASRPRRPRRRWPWALAIAGVVVVGGWGLWRWLGPAPTANLLTAPVTLGDVEQSVLATGTLKPARLVAIGAQVSGRLVSLKVALGQQIKAGDLIGEIDSLPQENALRTSVASLDNARAQRQEKEATLALAEASLARQQATLAQKASSRADYDTAEANVKTTRAQIAQLDARIIEAEVAVETARINLGYTRIRAPTDGTVLAVVTQEGQTVNAVQSAPTIVVVGQVDTMTVRTEISEADVVRVKAGQPVYFTILGDPGHRYNATLQSIEPAPESVKTDSSFTSTSSAASAASSTSSAVYYNGVFAVPNPDGRLRTYMTAEVHIVLGEAKGVLTIPSSALGAPGSDGATTVKVLERSGVVTTRTVKVGLNNKITAEIREGLKAGEKVVTGTVPEPTLKPLP
ncbi:MULTISPECIES: efflux RND transporter periplasmic adaptor subunit [unclassified Bradyrhizobium]|uniref:efflux RND transporter periplasmic adaptor subunit n=2 Tax=Bradyrhizobium TaxID=374 RepID=UPI0020128354|nr:MULTISPECIES: efflux RND transporter periplasmic adaptor subunit [unclassified Bradyrhizobium]